MLKVIYMLKKDKQKMSTIDNNSHIPAYVCTHVFCNERPILLVSHEDGDWQFLCGMFDHEDDGHVVGIGHLIERDTSLLDIVDLPINWEAERVGIDMRWLRTPCASSD